MSTPTLYEALIQPLRLLDEQEGGLLQRLLERPQFHVDATRDRILSLAATDDPATCPAELLQYLKDHVGFGSELGAVFTSLDAPSLRRLIRMAIPFWSERGTAHGIVAAARILSGRDPVYEDWFDRRALVGVSGIDGGLLLDDGAEYYSNLRVMDDGVLNEALLLALVTLLRPAGERIEITLLDFLDRFDSGLDRWQQSFGTPSAYIEDGALVLPKGSVPFPVVSSVPTDQMMNVDVSFRAWVQGLIDAIRFDWYVGASSYYRLFLSPTSPQVRISCVPGGIFYSADLIGGATMVSGAFYRCRIEVQNVPNAFIRLFFDDILQYESPSGGEAYPLVTSGGFRFGTKTTNTGTVAVDDVEIWRSPKRWALVGPSGVTVSPTYYGED